MPSEPLRSRPRYREARGRSHAFTFFDGSGTRNGNRHRTNEAIYLIAFAERCPGTRQPQHLHCFANDIEMPLLNATKHAPAQSHGNRHSMRPRKVMAIAALELLPAITAIANAMAHLQRSLLSQAVHCMECRNTTDQDHLKAVLERSRHEQRPSTHH